MAKVSPFKAVRPTRDKVSLVASRSYQSYTKAEVEARLDFNPYSFLHILNPGYKYAQNIKGKARYQLVKNRYLEFKEDEIFIKDSQPCFYIYKIIDRNKNTTNGILAATSIEDYKNNVIKKHEDTLEEREQVFKEYLQIAGFNAEPVLITYPDNTTLFEIINTIQKQRSEYEFATTYRDTHKLWVVTDTHVINAIKNAFKGIAALYIADGHHRTESSYLLYQDNMDNSLTHAFMSYLIPESDLKIYEFNRLIKDLNGLTKDAFLIKLDAMFRIENRGKTYYKPTKKHHFSMYLDGEFYSLYLRKTNCTFNTALDALDTQILYKTILEPVLGITNLRTDTRITYSKGQNDMMNIKTKVDSGAFKVGFGMTPVTIDEIKTIADNGYKMPPKSTYIEPKLRSGITIYEF